MEIFTNDSNGKEGFVNGPLSELLFLANVECKGCVYEEQDNGDFVFLYNSLGDRYKAVDVTADSLAQIVRDVFNNL